jgi:hypothetical protein
MDPAPEERHVCSVRDSVTTPPQTLPQGGGSWADRLQLLTTSKIDSIDIQNDTI